MLRRAVLVLCLLPVSLLNASGARAQTPAASPTPETLVRQWLDRWNALGGHAEAVPALVALFTPDALVTTGPDANQRGTAIYRGHDAIGVLATRLSATTRDMAWRLEIEAAREQSATLMHQTDGPWGGPAVAVQLVAVYSDAATGTRYSVPGTAFFQLESGRIRRLRLYVADGERVEIEPDPTRKRP